MEAYTAEYIATGRPRRLPNGYRRIEFSAWAI
jgi:hypothetical protein